MVIATRVDSTLSTGGFRLALRAQCQSKIVDVWCPPSQRPDYACTTPPTVRKEEVACPRELDFKSVRVSIRAPWGGVFSAMSDASGVVQIPVDWSGTGIDPLAEGAERQLATGWLVYSDDARAIPLKLQPGDALRMQSAIGAATDTQLDVGAANEKAILSADLAGGPLFVLGTTASLGLAITNKGPQPAYRVIAKLRSSVDALHGHQISFGRIDPGKTKIKTRAIAIPPKLDERSALVVAEITYFNGDPLDTKEKFVFAPEPKRVTAPRGLALDCKLATPEVAPGERVRITCDLRNLSSDPASDLGITVLVAKEASKNLVPKSLPGAGAEKLELIGLTSAREKQGAKLPVTVRATALGVSAVEWTASVSIASLGTRCKARLTRDEYKAKRKRLQAALDSGALTQSEFDKYDAELVGCLQ